MPPPPPVLETSYNRPYALWVLGGLQWKPIYQGTASAHRVAKRRAKNRVAKQTRKANR